SQHASHSAPALTVLPPRSAAAFGPNGGDNADQASQAIDGSTSTAWTTDTYRGSPYFGNLYAGTGLILDMGKQISVSSVTVIFGHIPGTHVRVEVGDNATGSTPADFATLD